MKRQRTPQEKKALSYAHDRRNAYGEADKATRKAIPLNKRLIVRKERAKGKDALRNEREPERFVRSYWRKLPDIPLAEWIAHQRRAHEQRRLRNHRDSS